MSVTFHFLINYQGNHKGPLHDTPGSGKGPSTTQPCPCRYMYGPYHTTNLLPQYHASSPASLPCCQFRARHGADSRACGPGSDRTRDWKDLAARVPRIAWKGPVFCRPDHVNKRLTHVNLSAGPQVFLR